MSITEKIKEECDNIIEIAQSMKDPFADEKANDEWKENEREIAEGAYDTVEEMDLEEDDREQIDELTMYEE